MNYPSSIRHYPAWDRNRLPAAGQKAGSFVAVPVLANMLPGWQVSGGLQQEVYRLAFDQAISAVLATRRRRRILFAAGSHRWN